MRDSLLDDLHRIRQVETMLKVYLVEDEFIIREAIRRTIDWKKENFDLVGEAGDGESAYPEILRTQPDILITDIRMPFMDGLELSRLVKKHLPQTKIVILSGFDDFSYAKEAISIGVSEYLLKPVSGDQLLQTLKKLAETIEEEKSRIDYKEVYEAEHAERLALEKNHFIHQVLDGRLSVSEVMEKSSSFGVRLTAALYNVTLVQLLPRNTQDAAKSDIEANVREIEERIVERIDELPQTEVYEQMGGVFCILCMTQGEADLEKFLSEGRTYIKNAVLGHPELNCFIAEGKPVKRISEIQKSYRDASRMFSRRFVQKESAVFSWKDAPAEMHHKEVEDVDLSSFNFEVLDRNLLNTFLLRGTPEDAPTYVTESLETIGAKNLNSTMLRQYIGMDTYISVTAFLKGLGCNQEEITGAVGPMAKADRMTDVKSLTQYMTELLSQAISLRDRSSASQYASIIQGARLYVEKHYGDRDISLSAVADRVGMSPSHFSRIFSQETGQTFVEYLTQYRMSKAREMLLATSKPSSEIALEVGYSDAHYFYYIFKKTQNITPKEFRAKNTRE